MSLNKKYLSPIGGASSRGYAPVRWSYMTTDDLATILAAGYFNDLRHLFTPGDTIQVQRVDQLPDNKGIGELWEIRVAETGADYDVVVEFVRLVHPGFYVRIPFWINETDLLAGTAQQLLCPVDGVITNLVCITKKQVTTGGDVTLKVGSTAVSGVDVAVADNSAVGTVGTSAPSSGESTAEVTADGQLQVVPSAAFATAGEVFGFVEVMTRRGNKDYTFFFQNATDYAAGTSHFLPNPLGGTVTKVGVIVQAATTGAGAVALKADNTSVVGLAITVPDGSAVGDVVTDTPTSGDASTVCDKNSDFEVTGDGTPSAGSIAGYIETEITEPPVCPVAKVQFMVGQTDLLAGTSHFMPTPVRGRVKQMNLSCQIGITTGGDVGLKSNSLAVLGEDGATFALATGNSVSAGADMEESVQQTSLTAEVDQYDDLEQTHAAAFATAGAINTVVLIEPTQ